jgi:hypothetical protein
MDGPCEAQELEEPMTNARSVFRLSQDLRSSFGHENRMFELGGQSAIPCAYCPIVFGVEFGKASSCVDHRFNRKAHAWKQPLLTALAVREVGDVGILMKSSS